MNTTVLLDKSRLNVMIDRYDGLRAMMQIKAKSRGISLLVYASIHEFLCDYPRWNRPRTRFIFGNQFEDRTLGSGVDIAYMVRNIDQRECYLVTAYERECFTRELSAGLVAAVFSKSKYIDEPYDGTTLEEDERRAISNLHRATRETWEEVFVSKARTVKSQSFADGRRVGQPEVRRQPPDHVTCGEAKALRPGRASGLLKRGSSLLKRLGLFVFL